MDWMVGIHQGGWNAPPVSQWTGHAGDGRVGRHRHRRADGLPNKMKFLCAR